MRRLIIHGLTICAVALCATPYGHFPQAGAAPANQAAGATSGRIPDSAAEGEANRQSVLAFYDAFFNKHDLSAADRYVAQECRQHSPGLADGRRALQDAYAQFFQHHPDATVEVVRSVAQGDLVVLHVHSVPTPGDQGDAVVDIFRVADGKIVEHWSVSQPVPASATGMF
ncbi:nuclear transport factor 2 family protein [Nitrospirillum iridis]|uniref:Putative SnoaL-like aldol condensation-catalyzing enzyme n=1 Tax=Nitrospirillum iridis TaxID=765888 RepID=A0A7X0ECB8_9PROT|nr:nuclear transport factor 2 family protein [Nitrospirillum iridis]MBB6251473.1 putative SnoaL-like aldol condensation-catalyzing enzyme [Nitrospirillum iridis]